MSAIRVALTLALGSAGGALCWYFDTPLPWMIGAMTVVTIAAVGKIPVRAYTPFRTIMITVLGVLLGSSFTPALLHNITSWPLTLGCLVLYSAMSLLLGMLYFRRVAGADTVTAYFSAAPGGLNEMILMGGQMGGDVRTIALSHSVRILVVVLFIPIWFRLFEPEYAPAARAAADISIMSVPVVELAKLAACAVIGYFAGTWLRLPAASMLGPMFVSAVAHMTGLTAARPPTELVSAAQVVMGVTVGCRFAGTNHRELLRLMAHGTAFAALLIGIAVSFAWTLHWITQLSTTALTLAYAPGGLAEMSLVALALSVDVAFVATHHAARLFIVLLLGPVVFRFLRAKRPDKSDLD